jgi:SAM-dependent methyltransferase
MEDFAETIQLMKAYGEARAALDSLDLTALALVRGALQGGLLTLAREPFTPTQFAEIVQLDKAHVAAVCAALDAYGILARDGDSYRLEDSWMVLTRSDLPFPLDTMIDFAFARAYILHDMIAGSSNYWTTSPELRLAFAKGVSPDPMSPHSPRLLQHRYQESSTEIHELFSAGARYLELGCGVAGALLSLLQAYPKVTAVGVELAQDLLEEAQRRAVSLGLEDHVQFINMDARDFRESKSFDIVFWSQFFFPTESRAAALQTAWRALKPGGFLYAPLAGEPLIASENLRTDAGKRFTLARLLYGQWGIPYRTDEDLEREIKDAGFSDVQLNKSPIGGGISARRR